MRARLVDLMADPGLRAARLTPGLQPLGGHRYDQHGRWSATRVAVLLDNHLADAHRYHFADPRQAAARAHREAAAVLATAW